MHGMELGAPCVLVVDDGGADRVPLRRHVQTLGARMLEADDGVKAVELARSHDVAAILLDVNLPMMDGFEVVRQLRHAPRTAHIPVIMITEGRIGLAERQRGQALGAVSFLQRQDLDFDELRQQLEVLVKLHLRANGLQMQIHQFVDDHARLSASNPQVRALQTSLHRHLLLDLLTGLPNRMFFALTLASLTRRAARGGKGFALVWMDLDHLKRINERYERDVGDRLLLAVAERMEVVIRASDLLARIEGDTYGLILDGVTTADEAQVALRKLLAAAGEPFETISSSGQAVTLIPTLSVGVALYPRHGEEPGALLSAAEQFAGDVLRMGGDGIRIGWGNGPESSNQKVFSPAAGPVRRAR